MPAPYTRGQTLAWLSPDPEGIRVHRATVQSVEHVEDTERWLVSTERGVASVDHDGVGACALPLEPDIETEFSVRGDGYLVEPTSMELDRTLDQEETLDMDDDFGLD